MPAEQVRAALSSLTSAVADYHDQPSGGGPARFLEGVIGDLRTFLKRYGGEKKAPSEQGAKPKQQFPFQKKEEHLPPEASAGQKIMDNSTFPKKRFNKQRFLNG